MWILVGEDAQGYVAWALSSCSAQDPEYIGNISHAGMKGNPGGEEIGESNQNGTKRRADRTGFTMLKTVIDS